MNLHDAVLAVTPTFGDSGVDIAMAVVITALMAMAMIWLVLASWKATHSH